MLHVKIDCPPGKSRIAEVSRSIFIAGIALHQSHHPRRLLPKRIPRRMNAIAADVQQSAPAALHMVADIAGVIVEVAEESNNRPKLSDAALARAIRAAAAIAYNCES